ncbi:MAG: ROK family transcriptional regulator [Paracoccaceae bacterium]
MTQPAPLDLTISQRRILDLVRRNSEITRADLVPLTGLTAGAISRLVRELLDVKVLREMPRISGMRGQPALPLAIEGAGGISIGIAFPYGGLDLVVLDYSGKLLAEKSLPFDGRDPSELRRILSTQLEHLLDTADVAGKRIVGIGLAIPGHLRTDGSNEFVIPPTLDWLDTEKLTVWLSKAYNSFVFIENIANAAAISEVYATADTTPNDLAVINLGHGVGLGLMLSGRIHRGAGGLAGEIGSLFPLLQPRPSGHDLLTAMRSAGRQLDDIDELNRYAQSNDVVIDAWVLRAAQQLFPVVRMLHLMTAPERIVLTGMLPTTITGPLAEKLTAHMSAETPVTPLYPTRITASNIGIRSNAIGAAWLPIESEGWDGKDHAKRS